MSDTEARKRKEAWIASLTLRKPSDVFAQRLREMRKARGLTQTELAEKATVQSIRLSRAALLQVEKGARGVSLDEALGLAAVLNAVPAHMLTPPDGEYVKLGDAFALDGAGIRSFLLRGFSWNQDPAPAETRNEVAREAFQLNLARHALALVDARRGDDKEGMKEAIEAISAEVLRRERERQQEERDGAE